LVVSFDRDSNDFWSTYLEIKMKPHNCMLISLYTFEKMWCLNCPFMSDLMLDPLLMFMMGFVFLSMPMMYEPCFCVKILSCWQHSVSMFVGIISSKPSRDFTLPLGSPRGLKGLLHMLNAIVSPTKEDLSFMIWFDFSFCFAKGLAKCKFVGIWWVPKSVYLDPLIYIS
jgi:hypothetical protein